MKLYHGIVIPSSGYTWAPFTATDYEHLRNLGLNSVQFEVWWTKGGNDGIEQTEASPNVYNQANLSGLDSAVVLAKSYGFDVAIGIRVSFFGDGGAGWSDRAGLRAKYVNNNLLDNAGLGGRTRFCSFVSYMSNRYKDCMIDPWFFPYHSESSDAAAETTLYETTQPALINAVRSVGNTQPIILNAMTQGVLYDVASGYKYEMGQFSNTRFRTMSDQNVIYCGNNHDGWEWSNLRGVGISYMDVVDADADWVEDQEGIEMLNRQLQPAVALSQTKPVGCVEFGAVIPFSTPIKQSRLAWLRRNFEIFKANHLSWWWYREERPEHSGLNSNGLRYSNGTLNELGQMVAEYAPLNTATFAFPVPYAGGTVDLSLHV